MKKLFSINASLKSIGIVLGFIAFFSACKKDEIKPALTLEKTSIEVFAGEEVTVQIQAGNGGYGVSSSSGAIAEVSVTDQTVIISGKAKGETTVTVKDQEGKTSSLKVIVRSAILDGSIPRFKWTNTIELEKPNGWSTTVLADRLSITNLSEKKQFTVLWNGGYGVGDKTEAKLRIVESGKTTEEIALTSLEVQKAENNSYSIIFSKESRQGILVFAK
jgi:hypothetical protein